MGTRAAYVGAAAMLTVTAMLTLVGCTTSASVIEQIRPRAAFDLNCPEDKIEINAIESGSYGAVGCGRRKRYETQCSSMGSFCTIRSDSDGK